MNTRDMADWPKYKQEKKPFFKKPKKPTTFFNPKTDPDPDRNRHLIKKPIPIPTDFQKSIPLGSRFGDRNHLKKVTKLKSVWLKTLTGYNIPLMG
jgi:hypothetical protein